MRRTVATFGMFIALTAFMTPVAMANVRVFHLCCPPKVQATSQEHEAMSGMEHCDHDGSPYGAAPAVQSDMSDCSRHMVSTAAPGVVHPASHVVVGRPAASHPILDEFAPLFAPAAETSFQKGRAPPANGQ
jgi:hypothetical protein